MANITEYLESIKSKNSGPFEICITLFFENEEYYAEAVEKNIINPEAVADIYSIDEEEILGIYELDNVNVIKFSMKRPVSQSSFHCSDLDGSQQHIPIKQLEVQ